MKVFLKKYDSLDNVPFLILDWARLIGGKKITIEDVNDLTRDYAEWLSKLDDKEPLDSTIGQ